MKKMKNVVIVKSFWRKKREFFRSQSRLIIADDGRMNEWKTPVQENIFSTAKEQFVLLIFPKCTTIFINCETVQLWNQPQLSVLSFIEVKFKKAVDVMLEWMQETDEKEHINCCYSQ